MILCFVPTEQTKEDFLTKPLTPKSFSAALMNTILFKPEMMNETM